MFKRSHNVSPESRSGEYSLNVRNAKIVLQNGCRQGGKKLFQIYLQIICHKNNFLKGYIKLELNSLEAWKLVRNEYNYSR